jgi:hypothetical protein
MKNFNPLWFIQDPIDPEHKEYILLDYLKSLTKKLNPKTSYSVLREISRIVKVLNDFKERKSINPDTLKSMKKDDREYFQNFEFKDLDQDSKSKIEEIIESSLHTLYDYSEVCLEILKEEESKIKIFRVEPETLLHPDRSNSGILIIRNMVTDSIEAYRWQGSVILKTPDGDKEVCIMKRIPLKNRVFSINYEYIYHEILEESLQEKRKSPDLYVIEIYENYNENSEILKMAKEKFIEKIS